MQEPNPAKKACPAIQSMLEECDASEEDAVLHVISEQCKLIQRVSPSKFCISITCPLSAFTDNSIPSTFNWGGGGGGHSFIVYF